MSDFLWDLSPRPLRRMAQKSQSLCRADEVSKRLHRQLLHNVTAMSFNCLLSCTELIGSVRWPG
jgi:hypothetical protein